MTRRNGFATALCALCMALSGCTRFGTPPAAPRSAEQALAASSVELTSSLTSDSLDFTAVAELVGDARIVMLGEPWHGDGGAIAVRAALVRYLHEKKDFDVLVFESDFHATTVAWDRARQTGELEEVKRQIYPFWVRTNAAAPLWSYVGATMQGGDTLHLAGMDPKLFGPVSVAGIGATLTRAMRQSGAPADAETAIATLEAALSPRPETRNQLTRGNFARLVRVMKSLERALADSIQPAGAGASGDRGFLAQLAESMRRNVEDERRDFGMGSNLIWLATRKYPGKKLIVWSHNNHILTDRWMVLDAPDSLLRTKGDAPGLRTTFLGDEARRAFGKKVVSIGLISHAGRYSPDIVRALDHSSAAMANFDSTVALTPAQAGTLEAELATAGRRVGLVTLRGQYSGASLRTRILEYTQTPPLTMVLGRGYDALLFVRETAGLNSARAWNLSYRAPSPH